ncbi:hypothetical protein [Amycolatopsis sp. lyj-112]|uniref:hypothetical protein n=1 Tax=Amycolatopsis sp. lyj-112 TaxID=2789288 RepID=UPI00397CB872
MTDEVDDLRGRFEARLSGLRSRRLLAVDYWDVHNFASEPARWDYGNWHHAVMGVGLSTDAGPATITWTDTFYRNGVEVLDGRIEDHLSLRDEGTERNGPDVGSRSPWDRYLRRRFARPPLIRSDWNWATPASRWLCVSTLM